MSIAGELERLAKLREAGAINDAEFAKAKEAILSGGGHPSAPVSNAGRDGESLGQAANRAVSVWIIICVIGLVLALVFFFAFFLPQWKSFDDRFEKQWNSFPTTPSEAPFAGR